MKDINLNILNILSSMEGLETFKKFDVLLSLSNLILHLKIKGINIEDETIKLLLKKIESFRYEMAYNKAIELIAGRLDKVLVYESLKLAKLVFVGKDLIKYLSDVLYYEQNEDYKEQIQLEIDLYV